MLEDFRFYTIVFYFLYVYFDYIIVSYHKILTSILNSASQGNYQDYFKTKISSCNFIPHKHINTPSTFVCVCSCKLKSLHLIIIKEYIILLKEPVFFKHTNNANVVKGYRNLLNYNSS